MGVLERAGGSAGVLRHGHVHRGDGLPRVAHCWVHGLDGMLSDGMLSDGMLPDGMLSDGMLRSLGRMRHLRGVHRLCSVHRLRRARAHRVQLLARPLGRRDEGGVDAVGRHPAVGGDPTLSVPAGRDRPRRVGMRRRRRKGVRWRAVSRHARYQRATNRRADAHGGGGGRGGSGGRSPRLREHLRLRR